MPDFALAGMKIGNVVVGAGARVIGVDVSSLLGVVLVVSTGWVLVALAASAAPSGMLLVGAMPAALTQKRSAPEPNHLPLRVQPRGTLPFVG